MALKQLKAMTSVAMPCGCAHDINVSTTTTDLIGDHMYNHNCVFHQDLRCWRWENDV
jgi:hypothetical protein